ncbi:MAG: molybdopterin molybdotransferase MoeA [Flavobacteriales bacterium]|jgi:molybdopterin molybdotransferase|nr:molybdopterin molybdotransferase MoeA [Flavobacteriales bacterium]
MTDVDEAYRQMMAQAPLMPVEELLLAGAGDHYAAADIRAPHAHPLFDMSAMDGYAFAFDPAVTGRTVVGSVAAGEVHPRAVAPGECVRIFTGAMMPPGTDTVVMQERTDRAGGVMRYTDAALRPGGNVRRRAEQVRRGDVVVTAGTHLGPAAIGLLATVGAGTVPVYRMPSVGLLLTGGEFVAGDAPEPGRIFNSNGVMLATALRQEGLRGTEVRAPDEEHALDAALGRLTAAHHVVISTGGASVGDHDLVHAAVLRAGGTVHFHGVAQKPGKPMLFATVDGRPFIGLPGNPRAVMVLCWAYVLPFLRRMQGAARPDPERAVRPLEAPVRVKGARAEFRAARVVDGRVRLLADEGSHMLRSLADADHIAVLPAHRREWAAGDPVDVWRIPHQRPVAP